MIIDVYSVLVIGNLKSKVKMEIMICIFEGSSPFVQVGY